MLRPPVVAGRLQTWQSILALILTCLCSNVPNGIATFQVNGNGAMPKAIMVVGAIRCSFAWTPACSRDQVDELPLGSKGGFPKDLNMRSAVVRLPLDSRLHV